VAAETLKFTIGKNKFEMPEIDDLNFAEWELIYDNTGLTLSDFAPAFDENGKLDEKAEADRDHRISQPAFTRTRLQLALQRANPQMLDSEAEEITKRITLLDAIDAIGEQVAQVIKGDDALPPESTPELSESSTPSSDDSSANGSTDSTDASAEPEELPLPTGTPA
jgi:hypothetical protein